MSGEANCGGPLEGTRVLDLTIARAGPTCVRQLADLGAEVIRIAHPRRGDLGGSDAQNLHRNKRSLLLDLKTEPGREAFLRLVDRADVLVENFRSDVKRRLRIDYAVLAQRNPRLVYASISGFGQDGPYATRAGVDQIAQGLGGLMSVTGPPGDGPWRAGIAISDTAAPRGDDQLHGLPGRALAHRRRGAAAIRQRPPHPVPDGDLPRR
jgi:crotonobetainyl-CoA:carnitine CoA-transferase CaiB-like acyl-CoA transferase